MRWDGWECSAPGPEQGRVEDQVQGRGRGGYQWGRKLHTPGLAQVQALCGRALVSRALTSTAVFTGQEAPLSPGLHRSYWYLTAKHDGWIHWLRDSSICIPLPSLEVTPEADGRKLDLG